MNRFSVRLMVACLVIFGAGCADDQPRDSGEDAFVGDDVTDDIGGARDIEFDGAKDGSDSVEEDSEGSELDVGGADISDTTTDTVNPPTLRTLADYRRCESDVDCPVGLGDCLKSVPLNRADSDGAQTVAIREIFPRLEQGEGVCSFVCTNGEDVCAGLSVNGDIADEVAHTCQVVVLGEAPYPAQAPAFPFDDQLLRSEQVFGQPFGAICRPPLRLDPRVEDAFGSACAMPDGCSSAGALCFNFMSQQAAVDGEEGMCLTPCADDAGCALGFLCDASDADGQTYCRPELDTFGACQDIDGDGFGSGLCATGANPVTPHDCDDRNPAAYFDPDDSQHAFPTFCGDFDYNCNGLSDADEQVGAGSYPEEHCASCFDVCAGALPNGQKACRTVDSVTLAASCKATCADTSGDGLPDFANCDDDLSNGCEVPINDTSRLYYRDADGDGYGDPNDVEFACDPSLVPAGYVANRDDCDDTSSRVYGGANPAAEICDGLDNNCDGRVDELSALGQAGDACNSPETGVCKAGVWVCGGAEGWACEPNIAPDSQTEICDGLDNNCDGRVDEIWSGAMPPFVGSNYVGYYADADNDGYGDAGAAPIYACAQPVGYVANNSDCDDANAQASPAKLELCATPFDDNCDGLTNDASSFDATPYYPDADADTYGALGEGAMFCERPAAYAVRAGDCDDLRAQVNPAMAELCATPFDDNCDGQINENNAADGITYVRDADEDQYGDAGDSVVACEAPAGYILPHFSGTADCNDSNAAVSPAAAEICNGVDDNCNATIDGGCPDGTTSTSGGLGVAATSGYFVPGDAQATVSCPANQVLVGLLVRKTNEPDRSRNALRRIDPRCAAIEVVPAANPKGYAFVHGPITQLTGPGTLRGTGVYEGEETNDCPTGQAVFQITTKVDDIFVLGLSMYCREFDFGMIPSDSEVMPYSMTTQTGVSHLHHFYNTPVGMDQMQCGLGKAVTKLKLSQGVIRNGLAQRGVALHCGDVALDTK